MILVIIGLILAITGLSAGFVLSKRKFVKSITSITDGNVLNIDHDHLDDEFYRISKLQDNLIEINRNIDNINIPSPESLSSDDDADSSLNKITQFFEEYNLATVGTEQFILSLLPTSQIGQSLHAIGGLLPQNIGHEIFGEAYASIKDSIMTITPLDGITKFLKGMVHLNKFQIRSMYQYFEHEDFARGILVPIKSGVMEFINVHDAGQQLISSIKEVGADLSSSLESSVSVGELADAADIDITGHIPVITIGISSFREFQLLSEDKTDFITSVLVGDTFS